MAKGTNATPKMSINQAAEFLGLSVQAIHKQLKAKNIEVKKLGNKSYIDFNTARELFNLKFKKRIIAGQIVKGGTGKTTVIDNISSCVNAYGARVLKIDADPQGNLTDVNDVDASSLPVMADVLDDDASIESCIVNISDGLDIMPSRIDNVTIDNLLVNKRLPLDRIYASVLEPVIDNYDFIFIDCPPYIGQAVTAAALFADTILIPMNPDAFSAKGLNILKNEVKTLKKHYKKNVDFRVFLNKFSGKTLLSHNFLIDLVQDPELENKFLNTVIPYAQELPNIVSRKTNLFCDLKKSITRSEFDSLTRELLNIAPPKEDNKGAKGKQKKLEAELA